MRFRSRPEIGVASGRTIGWYQDWLANPSPETEYWRRQSHRESLADLTTPASMLTGWGDLFLPWMLRDYGVLVAAGNAAGADHRALVARVDRPRPRDSRDDDRLPA